MSSFGEGSFKRKLFDSISVIQQSSTVTIYNNNDFQLNILQF